MEYTLNQLIECYRTDPYSSFFKLSYTVRVKHERLLSRISREHGSIILKSIRTRTLMIWHHGWLGDGNIAMAHSLLSRLRVLFRFGAALLEDSECERLMGALEKLRFEKGVTRRDQTMSREQAEAIRAKAHWRGWPSIALAQALQFELSLRQKDCIGEWLPMSEPGFSDVTHRDYGKWFRGLRWEEIDAHFVLRRSIGKREKNIEAQLRLAPMVMEELSLMCRDVDPSTIMRSDLPPSGPVILNEISAYPYTPAEFRRKWRLVANLAGVPKHVTNRDSHSASDN
jgi:hypothetical protein